MIHLLFAPVLASVISGGLASPLRQAEKPWLYYIPHTHWEGAVFNTREEYLQFGLDHILEAMRLMDRYPQYTFALDQVAYFKPFLERYPEEAARFRRYVKEGRLELVGGMDVMPDEVKPSGELLVRQIQYGQNYCRKEFGKGCDVAWLLDTFGHTPQLPQILDESGFSSLYFSRGVPTPNGPTEFHLEGLDGSSILAMWLKGFYGLFYGPPRDQEGFNKFFEGNFHYLDQNAMFHDHVGLAGNDVSQPEEFVPPLVAQFNQENTHDFRIRYGTPTQFADLAAKRTGTPTERYDQNPIFTGTFSSRTELRQTAKEIERDLNHAELFSALNASMGIPADVQGIWDAWEPTLFNQTHDLASGTMNDHTYFDTVRQYSVSRALTDNLLATTSSSFVRRVDTSGPGTAVVVFNPQGWTRTDSVDVDLGFAEGAAKGLRVLDSHGREAVYQATSVEKYSDGALERVKLTFIAKDVPACGYEVFRVVTGGPEPVLATGGGGDSLENEFYRVKVDGKTGAITSIWDKSIGREMLSGPANVVSRIADKGDLWTLYHELDGTQYLPTLDKQPVPTTATGRLSSQFADKPGTLTRGAAFSEFSVRHPFDKGEFSTRIRLTRGVKRIDIETSLVNQTPQVRYQALFPTAFPHGNYVQEVAFGALERPQDIEYPAQNWVDAGDGQGGVALLNFAMPGNIDTDGTLMLSLLRSVTEGNYNGGDNSNTGLEIGTQRTFRYALVPHAGDWRSAHLAQAGQEFASPLLGIKAEAHAGPLPKRWQGISFSDPGVVLSAVQPAEHGDVTVRFYESTGRPVHGLVVRFGTTVVSASASNLLGDALGKIPVSGSSVHLDLHPFEIKTVRLRFVAGSAPLRR